MTKKIIIGLAIAVPLVGIYLYRKSKKPTRVRARTTATGEILTPRSEGNISTNVFGQQEVKNKLAGTQGGSAVNTGLFKGAGELKTF